MSIQSSCQEYCNLIGHLEPLHLEPPHLHNNKQDGFKQLHARV